MFSSFFECVKQSANKTDQIKKLLSRACNKQRKRFAFKSIRQTFMFSLYIYSAIILEYLVDLDAKSMNEMKWKCAVRIKNGGLTFKMTFLCDSASGTLSLHVVSQTRALNFKSVNDSTAFCLSLRNSFENRRAARQSNTFFIFYLKLLNVFFF